MEPSVIKEYTSKFLVACQKFRESNQEDADNFKALLMAFTLHKRSARHGSGRKDESRASLVVLCDEIQNECPELVMKFLIAYFTEGYWKDAWLLLLEPNLSNELQTCTMSILVDRLEADHKICQLLNKTEDDEERKSLIMQLSNCAKFCPQVKGK
jgi:hypothetical protein